MDTLFRPRKASLDMGFQNPYNPFISENSHPPNENEQERAQRIRTSQEAQRISRQIDAEIAESKKAFDRRERAVKILLLGQSESGKSTVLKNFQMAFTPNHFQSERRAWHTVIQLNLIGSVKRILDALEDEWGPAYSSPLSGSPPPLATHRRIRMSLSPLLSIETTLSKMLNPTTGDSPELCVRAGGRWKALLDPREHSSNFGSEKRSKSEAGRPRSNGSNHKNDPTQILAGCQQEIITLWEDQTVRDILHNRGINLESSAGFFLNDTARIATTTYEPTDSDIVRARVRTMGIEEHCFVMETADAGEEYYIYDVGGSRGMRPQWIPYFENVHAILFLAPLAFNQVLEEDPRVNRLEDSLCLWREICCNPLLANATLILFLNKMDILRDTLDSGVVVKKYVPSFGNAPNDVQHVTKYFREKFRAYHKRLSPKSRPFMCYETSAIDTNATKALLDGVRESILRHSLQRMAVI